MIADRPEIVKAYFDIDIKFDPAPLLGCLYFLTKTAQVIRLQQLGNVVVIQDLEAGQKNERKLVEFVKQAQSGDWLLKPRSGALQADKFEPAPEGLGPVLRQP
jgi:hypothetical protein